MFFGRNEQQTDVTCRFFFITMMASTNRILIIFNIGYRVHAAFFPRGLHERMNCCLSTETFVAKHFANYNFIVVKTFQKFVLFFRYFCLLAAENGIHFIVFHSTVFVPCKKCLQCEFHFYYLLF